MNRDVNLLELGQRPWSSPTLDSGRHSRVEEREVDPESGDYGPSTSLPPAPPSKRTAANGAVMGRLLGSFPAQYTSLSTEPRRELSFVVGD